MASACVQGASHIRNNMPCQDALRAEKIKRCHIVSLSDGHGSAACPFSDEGSKIAVDTACSVFGSIFSKGDSFQTISANKDIWLPKQIEQHWKTAVQAVHKERERDPPQDDGPFPYELYGATLLTLVAADDFIFALQLGDGDILSVAVTEEGENVDWVIPPDGHLGPETHSLCQDECWQYMQTRILRLDKGEKAPMFLLSTDGYANSFYNDDGFKQAGLDFYKLLHNPDEGLSYVRENLEEWLTQSSEKGSGDDIALALVLEG